MIKNNTSPSKMINLMNIHTHTHTHTHTHQHTPTHTNSQVIRFIQKEHPIFCSAVFSACLLHAPSEPSSHAASISLIQSICIPLSFLLISCSFPYFSPSWVPRCSHWYAMSANATINKGRWLSISVSEIIVLNTAGHHCMLTCNHSPSVPSGISDKSTEETAGIFKEGAWEEGLPSEDNCSTACWAAGTVWQATQA